MADVLEKLFGSGSRVKILRFFLLNPENLFDLKEISRRTKTDSSVARREILLLKAIGFLKESEEKIDELIKLKNGKIKNKKKKIRGFRLNILFPFLRQLKDLLINAAPIDREKLLKSINSTGKIKLVILSGIFIDSGEGNKVDLLIVGDSVRRSALDRLLKNIEAEIGRELNYVLFTKDEFFYRFNMYDRFIRDILDYPHEKLLNKLNI